ncbi:uncharacterized protein LOC129769697 isoform X1 [Toxorhynchites rutilus septentrionalis]|uniref:uncharacterized protein LOC129769697 isoform X1 n=1 Tax=Toxorhynchites rutilus septentrionalis TaxID=329112 RepID=UPI00247B0E89|nr:uncharacterized protein LOC129769697 isoform X1 [Toxorhynchites rutilus septentrionalis]
MRRTAKSNGRKAPSKNTTNVRSKFSSAIPGPKDNQTGSFKSNIPKVSLAPETTGNIRPKTCSSLRAASSSHLDRKLKQDIHPTRRSLNYSPSRWSTSAESSVKTVETGILTYPNKANPNESQAEPVCNPPNEGNNTSTLEEALKLKKMFEDILQFEEKYNQDHEKIFTQNEDINGFKKCIQVLQAISGTYSKDAAEVISELKTTLIELCPRLLVKTGEVYGQNLTIAQLKHQLEKIQKDLSQGPKEDPDALVKQRYQEEMARLMKRAGQEIDTMRREMAEKYDIQKMRSDISNGCVIQ